MLSIKPVTNKNRNEVEALDVFSYQKNFIETVAECLDDTSKNDA